MAKKKKWGTCCICGKETELTFEHIPPRAAFNKFALKSYDFFDFILHGNTKYTQQNRGAGDWTLCESCNNLTGKWYGAAYAEFANQGMKYFRSNAKGVLSVPYTIYPLRVFKQIVSCFASVNGPVWCKNQPQIKEFLLDPYNRRFPDNIDIRMYMPTENRFKIDRIQGTANASTGEYFFGSEWAYTPFSFICVADIKITSFRVLNELQPLRSFLQYGYDDRKRVYLNIPRKPCNPAILDFREDLPNFSDEMDYRRQQEKETINQEDRICREEKRS